MADKTLRKLKRAELLELLIEQGKENERLREQVEELKKKLEDKEILLERAGTIAEASFQLNGVLEAAEAAAQQYLDNLRLLNERQEQICAQKERERS
ncbi:MAG: DNA repair protein [Lachnospiraceae bacterium]|nr:DNA repair protein [Lachnospiraceae bacterium]